MTELLRKALGKAPSIYAVSHAAEISKPSLIRFLRGEQSLLLDTADRLAVYFGIESHFIEKPPESATGKARAAKAPKSAAGKGPARKGSARKATAGTARRPAGKAVKRGTTRGSRK